MLCQCGECNVVEKTIEKGNLIFSTCPKCKAVRTVSGWIKAVEGKKIPFGLTEENCPSCTLDVANKIRFGSPVIVV